MRLARKSLCQQLNLLLCQFQLLRYDPRDIAARSRKAFNVSTHNRIKIDGNHDDRDCLVRPTTDCSATAGPATTINSGCERTNSSALMDFRADHLRPRETRYGGSGPQGSQAPAFAPEKLGKACDRRRTGLGGAEETDPIALPDFLRAYSERNRGHAAEQTYEVAPPHSGPRHSGPAIVPT